MALLSHTSHEFEAELRQLKGRLLAMGGRCEQMIIWAVSALEEQNVQLAEDVMRADRQMNEDEMAVDEMTMRMLALRQPVGRDLRFAITAVKVVTDLERIGDEAVNLAERASELAARGSLPEPTKRLSEMAMLSKTMLRHALDSFVEEDSAKARLVLAEDDEVDAIYGEILRGSIAFMRADPTAIDDGMRVSNCAKYLERIGDHATNIAEMVIFLVDGVDVRHGGGGGVVPPAPAAGGGGGPPPAPAAGCRHACVIVGAGAGFMGRPRGPRWGWGRCRIAGRPGPRPAPGGVCLVAVKSRTPRPGRARCPAPSLQNGLTTWRRAALAPTWPGMMTFNVIPTEAGFRQATAGPLVFGPGERPDSQRRVQQLRESVRARGFDARVRADMPAVQLGKLLLNLNNGLCALTGLPLAAMLANRTTRTVFAAAIREGLEVARAAGRPVGQLGVLSPRLVALALGLPDAAFFRVSRAMLAVDPAAKTSTLQDLERGRLTEIDELNGAITALARAHGRQAPINALITRGVHELEAQLGTGALPYWSPETLRERVAAALR
ncbi:MAG: phosphate signaling complex protein PhoU [Sandaracinaceae bacterium]|nr:phosphate signaling complex protein PhoU [Sandaracinaceae bacterium]